MAVQSLLASLRVFDLSKRRLYDAAVTLGEFFGLQALPRVSAMLADVLTDPAVHSPGAVAAYRIGQLGAGDLRGWPV
jgi:hypothetical protein